ncbi:MAG: low molecular weight protein arginine phosphatase [Clostridia bacterium]|nr:low molecular weight protein arginine phosphatase [Clostridia bacterium]
MADAVMTAPEKEKEDSRSAPYLFVCSGNTCRSPMAAALFNWLFGPDGRRASSAGLVANGSGISSGALHALKKRGVPSEGNNDYEKHVSRNVTREDIENARLVIAVTGFHATQLIMRFPEFATKISVLPEDVPDPFGGTDEEYDECLSMIERMLREVFPPAKENGGRTK